MNRHQRRAAELDKKKQRPETLARANARLRAELSAFHATVDAHHEKHFREHPETKISCTKGCSACCRQIVMTELSEAELIVAKHPDAVRRALPKLVEHNRRLGEKMRGHDILGMWQDSAKTRAGAAEYWRLNMPCAFLEGGLCSIYESRPIPCRSHFVLSDPERCAGDWTGATDVVIADLGSRTTAPVYWVHVVAARREGALAFGALPQLVLRAWSDRGHALPEDGRIGTVDGTGEVVHARLRERQDA